MQLGQEVKHRLRGSRAVARRPCGPKAVARRPVPLACGGWLARRADRGNSCAYHSTVAIGQACTAMSTPQPHIQHPRSKLGRLWPADEERRKRLRLLLLRVLVAANLILDREQHTITRKSGPFSSTESIRSIRHIALYHERIYRGRGMEAPIYHVVIEAVPSIPIMSPNGWTIRFN